MTSGTGKRKKGFTLTEILVSIVILGLIMGAVLGLFFAIVKHLEQSNDITTAQQRGEMVLTALGPKIMAAGLGMPETSGDTSGDKFETQFSALALPDSWGAAVMVSEDNKELTVIYSEPTDAIVSGEKSFSSGDVVSVDFLGTIPPNTVKRANNQAAGWVVFPSTGVAMEVIDDSPQTSPLELKSHAGGKIYSYDHLHLVRVAQAKIDNENWFLLNDAKPLVTHRIVEGIADIRFYLDSSTNPTQLTVKVLARGGQRHDPLISPSTMPDWVDQAEPPNPISISTENQHYRLKVVQRTWRLRNL